MREDRVSNVRLTLVDALKVMPEDILKKESVSTILTTLEDEARTWDVGFGAEEYGNDENAATTRAASTSTRGWPTSTKQRSSETKAEERKPLTPNRRSKFDRSAGSPDGRKKMETRQEKKNRHGDDGDDESAVSLSSI